jgi:hypothetical protein
MPYEELLGWQHYLRVRPVGWRDDFRTVKIMQSFGFKGKGEDVFASLAALSKTPKIENGNAKGLKNSVFYQKMITAIGSSDIIPGLNDVKN